MYKFFAAFSVLYVLVAPATSQNWVNSAKFENFAEYFPNLIQETIYEVERRGWSNLGLNEIQVNINERIYDRHFVGTVLYSNGFLISIQKMTVSNIMQSFMGTATVTGTMAAQLNLHDVKIGYDVIANLTDLGEHRFTGTYTHGLILFQIRVNKNMNTDAVTTSVSLSSLLAGNLMEYMPQNDIAEVLSRHYRASDVWNGIATWGSQHMVPIMTQLIQTLNPIPEICFNC